MIDEFYPATDELIFFFVLFFKKIFGKKTKQVRTSQNKDDGHFLVLSIVAFGHKFTNKVFLMASTYTGILHNVIILV